jgi:integrase
MALTDTFIKSVKYMGGSSGEKYADGQGLYLHVKASGKYWRMAYRFNDKQLTLSFGIYPALSLLKARRMRDDARSKLAEGIDPGVAKRESKETRLREAVNTFEHVAREWLAKTASGRAESTQQKVTAWLANDIFPYIGSKPIRTLAPRDFIAALKHMERRGALDSLQRVKQICGQVLRYAVVHELAERDVTTDIKGAFEKHMRRNFSGITDPGELAQLLRAIDGYNGHYNSVAALRLAPMLFVRPGELQNAEWSEVNLDTAEWRIPAAKMKMKLEHLVPLSTQAVAILRKQHELTGHGRYVFPSLLTRERPMSENTLNTALRRMGYDKKTHTAHGFRATARTILDEVLGERVDLIEHQLSHAVKDANGRAYNRTTHLPARRQMMQRWADYLDTLKLGVNVTQMPST